MSTTATETQVQFTLKNVRLSYPNLFKPRAFEGADASSAKFSASFILDKTEHVSTIAEIKAAIAELCKTELKVKALPADKVCLRDGESKGDSEGYGPDVMFISASNTRKPAVIDRDKTAIADTDARIFGGIYVNAVIRLWVQNNKFGKRINASLEAVQYVRKGDAFGAAPVDLNEALPDLPDEDDGEDLMG